MQLVRVRDIAGALRALTHGDVPVVLAGVRWARALITAGRSRRELACTHIVVGAALGSPGELREALDAGADDVMRVPFEPEVLVACVIHPEDRVMEGVNARRPFSLEYRIQRRDGDLRWVLERGQAQESGRQWLDRATFDITLRRAAEEVFREREVVDAQLSEVRASCARILEAADRARRGIERNLHDGAQQRFVSVTLDLQRLAARGDLPDDVRRELDAVLAEFRTGLAELRDLAHGLHPAVVTDRGLEQALRSLAHHAAVPVELRVALPGPRLATCVEAAAYFTVSEALTNVAKYAHATRAWVDVEQLERYLGVEVGDDGAGGADLQPGSGLQRLSDRIAAANGTLTIDSARRRHDPASATTDRLITPGPARPLKRGYSPGGRGSTIAPGWLRRSAPVAQYG